MYFFIFLGDVAADVELRNDAHSLAVILKEISLEEKLIKFFFLGRVEGLLIYDEMVASLRVLQEGRIEPEGVAPACVHVVFQGHAVYEDHGIPGPTETDVEPLHLEACDLAGRSIGDGIDTPEPPSLFLSSSTKV